MSINTPRQSRSEPRFKSGLEISKEFISTLLLPLLQDEVPEFYDRLSVAVVGTGSDVLGFDDEISRDHHWGPVPT
jgi:hypothetical protein